MLTQFEQRINPTATRSFDVARRYCQETLERCANFLPNFGLTANDSLVVARSLQNLAIFSPFNFNELSPGNQLPVTLAGNLENWYEYRTYHSTNPNTGELIRIAVHITPDLNSVNQLKIMCYQHQTYYAPDKFPAPRWERVWDWDRPFANQARIVNVNQHTELVIDYVRPHSIFRPV
jgi:hypothetical protein